MKRTTVYAVAGAILLVAAAAVELIGRSYLDRRLAHYRSERSAVEAAEQAYRRPVLDRNVVEQNAATWYARAFPSFAKTSYENLRPALVAGARQYDLATESLLTGACAETNSEAVQTALRCAYCNWQLGFGTASETRFEHQREGLELSLCLTIDGHRSAHQGAERDAARRYLEGLAVACDLGNGTESMLVVAITAAKENLTAIGKLATASSDPVFLRNLSADLADFEDHLPDGRMPERRALIWAQNVVSLSELEAGYENRGFGLLGLRQLMAVRALQQEDSLFVEAQKIAEISKAQDGRKLSQDLKTAVERSSNDFVREMNLPRSATLAASALELKDVYHDVMLTIDVQRGRLAPR